MWLWSGDPIVINISSSSDFLPDSYKQLPEPVLMTRLLQTTCSEILIKIRKTFCLENVLENIVWKMLSIGSWLQAV